MPTKKISDDMRRRCTVACENCKRRKERCDGNLPCGRCVARRAQAQCHYSKPRRTSLAHQNAGERLGQSLESATETLFDPPSNARGGSPHQTASQIESYRPGLLDGAVWTFNYPGTALPSICQLVRSDQGGSVFLGDSANESFLQQIRQLVGQALGPCPFIDEPIQYHILGDTYVPVVRRDKSPTPPTKPRASQASYFVSWSMRATSCLLGVVSESDVQDDIVRWLEQRDENTGLSTAVYYLILANGALSCPEDEDHNADAYFSYARYLTDLNSTDEPRLETILCYSWIAFYQLGTARRNAAYHSVGIAVRTACAIGIHRADLPCSMSADERVFRERLWKALRKLDLFISASLGRPTCTNETRDTKAEQGYSSTIDITAILEAILKEVYQACKVSRNFVLNMTKEHRLWATRIADGLKADGIELTEPIKGPNLAFYNMKESYYWSIMLLTRPFLLERASTRAAHTGGGKDHSSEQDEFPQAPHSDTALVYACVDSAIRTIDLLQCLLPRVDLPKRLPFVVNSAFGAALTLGVAIFGDLDRIFPLPKTLQIAEQILHKFGNHDPVAEYYRIVVEQLQSTCDKYVERRNRYMTDSQDQLVSELVGRVHGEFSSLSQTVDGISVSWTDTLSRTQQPPPHSPVGSLTPAFLTSDSSLDSDSIAANGGLSYLSLDLFQASQAIDMGYADDVSRENTFNLF